MQLIKGKGMRNGEKQERGEGRNVKRIKTFYVYVPTLHDECNHTLQTWDNKNKLLHQNPTKVLECSLMEGGLLSVCEGPSSRPSTAKKVCLLSVFLNICN